MKPKPRRLMEWNNLEEAISLHAVLSALAQAPPRSYNDDHANLIWYMSCKECSPFDVMDVFTPDASAADVGKDTCDYDTHDFKRLKDEDECDWKARNY